MPAMKTFVLFPGSTARASVFRQDGWSPATANWTKTDPAGDGVRPGHPRGDLVGDHGGGGFGRLVAVLDDDLDVVATLLHRRPRERVGRAEVADHVEGAAVGGGAEL